MYSLIELFLFAPVTVLGFELVAIIVLAVLRLSHASLEARRNAKII